MREHFVLFDDAFTNSDPERQPGVYRMLHKASEHGLQVISLTCDPLHVGAIQGQKVITLETPMTSRPNPRVHSIGQCVQYLALVSSRQFAEHLVA
jgi:hypothetical protein